MKGECLVTRLPALCKARLQTSASLSPALALLLAVGFWLFFMDQRGEAMNGAFILGDFAWLMKLLAIIGSITLIILVISIGINFSQ